MNKKTCKKIRKAVYADNSKRNANTYDNENSGTRVCSGLRKEYRKKKYDLKHGIK